MPADSELVHLEVLREQPRDRRLIQRREFMRRRGSE